MTSFDRYRPVIGAFFCAPLIMAGMFMASVMRGGSPVSPSDFGPIVFAIPAWFWALLQITFAGAAAATAFKGHPSLHAISAAALGVLFEFFAAAAWIGGATEILLVTMAIPTGALCFLAAGIGWGHGR